MKKNIFFLIFLVLGLFTNCNRKADVTSVLNVGVMSSMDYLPLAVAQREGYFEEKGITVKLNKFYSANERDAAFQSGSMDGIIIDYTGAILQKAGGTDLKLTSKCDAPFYIVAGSETGIDNLSRLKGKTIAVSQNTVIDYCMDMALRAAGINPEEVRKTEINKIPVRYEMLRNHKIDATGLPDPFALMAQEEGNKILTSNNELGFSITGIVFSGQAIHSKEELIRKMYEAYNMGVVYINSHPVEDIQNILIKEIGFPEGITGKVILPAYTKAGMPANEDVQLVVDWLSGRKLVDLSFDGNSLLDGRFTK